MTETAGVLTAALAGALLGLVFFGGLWWTVRRALSSAQTALWFSGSFLLRTAIVLMGIYVVSRGDWRRMAACMAGFLLARAIIKRLTGSRAALEGIS
jgi:F1F0 ATPase subunit 2